MYELKVRNTVIKNEPSIATLNFKKYRNLTKDQIEVCKDCEFLYICTDCRAYSERSHTNEEGLDTSKPLNAATILTLVSGKNGLRIL
ncbi:hypothetical protein [Chryseobacterium sp. CCH4-E10]|uniref:hypothetical protein n=1 Tax=Chryseobacterium sp. CCH4-E10 TaxID=1768758 RepID=UPI00083618E8|nr:hypothetical protein [Chryseobacterium sp. CCH4-E10]